MDVDGASCEIFITETLTQSVICLPLPFSHLQIPINETVLLHRHGVALVTARATVHSIAVIDWMDLVLHLWPSGTAATEGSGQTVEAQTTLFHDATSRAPAIWTTAITVEPWNGTGACDPTLLGRSPRRQRTVRVLIGREHETSQDGLWMSRKNYTATFERTWTLLVHLAPGEQLKHATVDGVAARSSVTHSSHPGSSLLTQRHGTVAELVLKRSPVARAVTLCISG